MVSSEIGGANLQNAAAALLALALLYMIVLARHGRTMSAAEAITAFGSFYCIIGVISIAVTFVDRGGAIPLRELPKLCDPFGGLVPALVIAGICMVWLSFTPIGRMIGIQSFLRTPKEKKLEARIEELEKELQTVRQQIVDFPLERQRFQMNLDGRNEAILKLEEQVKHTRRYRDERNKLRIERAQIEAVHERLQNDSEQLRAEFGSLKSENSTVAAERDGLIEEVEELKKDLADAHVGYSEIIAEHRKTKKRIEDIRTNGRHIFVLCDNMDGQVPRELTLAIANLRPLVDPSSPTGS